MTLAQIAILAAEEAEKSDPLDLLLPAPAELIAGAIAFVIVFFFVWRWAVPALNRTLEARQQAIGGQLAEAEQAKAEAESLLADYRAQLAESKAKQNEIIDQARATAETVRADIIAKAQAEAGQIVGKAHEEAQAEKSRVMSEAKADVANLSIDLAERVVGANLDRAAQLGLVERYLADLEK